MWISVAEAWDEPAWWAAAGLAQAGLAPFRCVTSAELAAAHWEHRGDTGSVSSRVRLCDGTEFTDTNLRGVLNRLTGEYIAPGVVAPQDFGYAAAESGALVLSWLSALRCPVVNRPAAVGQAAGAWSPLEWSAHARAAGFKIRPVVDGASAVPCHEPPSPGDLETVTVVAGEVLHGGCAPSVRVAAKRLARRAGALLIGIVLDLTSPSGPVFVSGSRTPDLRLGGLPLLRQLAVALS